MNTLRTAVTCILLALPAGSVPAQESEAGADTVRATDTAKTYTIDEVVITGTRTARKIVDVPYPVERVDGTDFSFDRKVAVDDALQGIPGLFLQSRYGNHDVRISMRGFGSRSNTGIRGIRILLDGIPESEPDGQTRIEAIDFNSLGAIELIRGNVSSAYTNAPGGVINFINDLYPGPSSVLSFNQFGSFGLASNGLKAKVNGPDYRSLATYNNHRADGYRPHSSDSWDILNGGVQIIPGGGLSTLGVYLYYVDGTIYLPGSLTKEMYDADPFQANPREVSRDTRRLTQEGAHRHPVQHLLRREEGARGRSHRLRDHEVFRAAGADVQDLQQGRRRDERALHRENATLRNGQRIHGGLRRLLPERADRGVPEHRRHQG